MRQQLVASFVPTFTCGLKRRNDIFHGVNWVLKRETHLVTHVMLVSFWEATLSERAIKPIRIIWCLLSVSHRLDIFFSLHYKLRRRIVSGCRDCKLVKRARSMQITPSLKTHTSLAVTFPCIVLKKFRETLTMFRNMLIFIFEPLSSFLHKVLGIQNFILCIRFILTHLSHFVHALYMSSKSICTVK